MEELCLHENAFEWPNETLSVSRIAKIVSKNRNHFMVVFDANSETQMPFQVLSGRFE